MEVVIALAKNLGHAEQELTEKMLQKREKRGAFDKRIILEKVYE